MKQRKGKQECSLKVLNLFVLQTIVKMVHHAKGVREFCFPSLIYLTRVNYVKGLVARGVCSRTHKRHVQLSGTLNGNFPTLIGQPYPKNFDKRVATAFSHAMFHRLSRPLMHSFVFS